MPKSISSFLNIDFSDERFDAIVAQYSCTTTIQQMQKLQKENKIYCKSMGLGFCC